MADEALNQTPPQNDVVNLDPITQAVTPPTTEQVITPDVVVPPVVEAVKAQEPEKTWREDWREQAIKEAGFQGNEADDVKKQLERYASPAAVTKALVEMRKKLSSGEYKIPAPQDPEALGRWRKENGIPETSEGYDLQLNDGFTLGEEDMPIAKGFLDVAHSKNLDNGVVKDVLSWYKGMEKISMEQEVKALQDAKVNTVNELKAEWGAEFEANQNMVKSFLTTHFGEELGNSIEYAIGSDGIPLGSKPNFIRAMNAIARDMNIGDIVVPGSVNKMDAISDEKAAIEKKMGTKSYTNDDRQRYMDLVIAEDKLGKRK